MDKNNSPYSPLPEQPPSPYPPTPYPPPEQANPYPPPPQQGGEYVLSQQQPYVSYQQGGGYNPQQGYPPQQQPYGTPQPYAGQGGYAQPYAQPYNPLQNPAGYNTIVVTGDSDAPFIATCITFLLIEGLMLMDLFVDGIANLRLSPSLFVSFSYLLAIFLIVFS